jgi:hypothetical protein
MYWLSSNNGAPHMTERAPTNWYAERHSQVEQFAFDQSVRPQDGVRTSAKLAPLEDPKSHTTPSQQMSGFRPPDVALSRGLLQKSLNPRFTLPSRTNRQTAPRFRKPGNQRLKGAERPLSAQVARSRQSSDLSTGLPSRRRNLKKAALSRPGRIPHEPRVPIDFRCCADGASMRA